jgi:hypothetical protein
MLANFKRTDACKGCKEGCAYANITLTLKVTGDYQTIERAMMFAIAASRGTMPERYTKKEVPIDD